MCMIDCCDEGYVVYNRPSEVTARKVHRCDECRRDISIGQRYWRASGLYDGRWYRHAICAECHSTACEWLMRNCRGFLHEGVEEDIREHFEEAGWGNYPAGERVWLGRVLIGMRRKWRGVRVPAARPAMQVANAELSVGTPERRA